MSSSPIINVIHEEVILVRLFARAEICEATEERTVLKSACIAGGFLLHLRDPRLVFRRWWDVITQIDDVCFHLLHSPGIGIQPIIEGRGHGRLSFYRRVYFVCEKGATGGRMLESQALLCCSAPKTPRFRSEFRQWRPRSIDDDYSQTCHKKKTIPPRGGIFDDHFV